LNFDFVRLCLTPIRGEWAKRCFIVMITLFTGYFVNAQTATGVITDAENGDPIIGATILEMGTESNGTTTDFEGKFNLILQTDNPVLQVSYVGYQSVEIPFTGQESLDIELFPGLVVDEVVVTALGVTKERKALGYA